MAKRKGEWGLKLRVKQHLRCMQAKPNDTVEAVMKSHRMGGADGGGAKDWRGRTCSLPMKMEKAIRIASALHRVKV